MTASCSSAVGARAAGKIYKEVSWHQKLRYLREYTPFMAGPLLILWGVSKIPVSEEAIQQSWYKKAVVDYFYGYDVHQGPTPQVNFIHFGRPLSNKEHEIRSKARAILKEDFQYRNALLQAKKKGGAEPANNNNNNNVDLANRIVRDPEASLMSLQQLAKEQPHHPDVVHFLPPQQHHDDHHGHH